MKTIITTNNGVTLSGTFDNMDERTICLTITDMTANDLTLISTTPISIKKLHRGAYYAIASKNKCKSIIFEEEKQ